MKKFFTALMTFSACCMTGNAQNTDLEGIQFQFKKHAPTTQHASGKRFEQVYDNSSYFPHVGNPKALVILAEFQDVRFSVDDPKGTFEKYLNGSYLTQAADGSVGRNYGSVAQYFDDCSFGLFRPQFDLVGPVLLSEKLSTYGKGSNDRIDLLLPEVCKLVDDEVDFSEYDSNNDGAVDLVYVIYAGYSESISGNSSDCIWPKSGITSGGTYDGKRVSRYGVNGELNGTPETTKQYGFLVNGIGLFCHEFSHCLGLPDLYGYETSDASKYDQMNNQGMEYWDLMDAGCYLNNGYTPIPYTAWEREAMGWLEIDTLDTPANITLATVQDGAKAYRLLNDNDATGHEYFMLENIQKKGWASYANGHGLLVTHVDFAPYTFEVGGRPNGTNGHPRMTVVAADGLLLSSYLVDATYKGKVITQSDIRIDEQGDPFPGTSGNTELTDESVVKFPIYTGTAMDKPITEIAETADGVVTFKFMGGMQTAVNSLSLDAEGHGTTAVCYTLDGRRVGNDWSQLPKGIYIIGKQKVVVR